MKSSSPIPSKFFLSAHNDTVLTLLTQFKFLERSERKHIIYIPRNPHAHTSFFATTNIESKNCSKVKQNILLYLYPHTK